MIPSPGSSAARPVWVLLAGESWTSYRVNVKGFNAYYAGFYDEGRGTAHRRSRGGRLHGHIRPQSCGGYPIPRLGWRTRRVRLVILSDIGSDTLQLHPDTSRASQVRPDRLAVLADWVRDGGGLLMVGGHMSFAGYGPRRAMA